MPTLVCPVCGTDNPSTRTFCRKCASDLRAAVLPPGVAAEPEPEPVPVKPIAVGAGVAALLVLLAIGLFIVLTGSPAASPSPSPSLAPASATPAANPSPAPTAAATATLAPPTSTPAPTGQGAPVIRSFEGPETVNCSDPSFTGTIRLSWRVGNADGATLSIDGPGIYTRYTGVLGQDDVPFACGGEPHTYLLTTTGGTGPAATQLLVISPAG